MLAGTGQRVYEQDASWLRCCSRYRVKQFLVGGFLL